MSPRQIHHMQIVTHPSAIWRRIVVAKYLQIFPLPRSDLRDVGHQVVRYATGRLANQAALMRPHGVEITQDGNLPAWVCRKQFAQRVFAHEFAATVGIGGREWGCFRNRHNGRVAVHRGRRAENNTPQVGAFHGLQQMEGA